MLDRLSVSFRIRRSDGRAWPGSDSTSRSRVRIPQVVHWQHFEASEWDIEYDVGKLASHGISDWEAEEVIFNVFVARPNKKVHGPDRYQLAGRTDGGRALLLIVHVFGERQMRVLNGWSL